MFIDLYFVEWRIYERSPYNFMKSSHFTSLLRVVDGVCDQNLY